MLNERLFQSLLEYFNLSEQEYRELTKPVSFSTFAQNKTFDGIENAVGLLKQAVCENKKILIYGDYDCDGIMGTSILVKMFEKMNYIVDYQIPNRYLDNYGLNISKAKEYVEKQYNLIITVDNGVSCFEAIQYLKDNNVDVIVIDHHTIPEQLPNANYIIHPTYSHFGNLPSSGAFTAFMFSKFVLGYFDKYLGTLASISLISDMMPLKEYNRDLLRICIDNYIEGEFKAIDLLKENERFTEETIGMKIAPKINALGRIIETNDLNKIVEYFITDNNDKLLNYLEWINTTNETRKILSKQMIEKFGDFATDKKAVVLYDSQIKEGLLGLVANQICTKIKKPVIIFTNDSSNDTLKGSARAPEGFNIIDCFAYLKDKLVCFGGHALAGGCSIKMSDLQDVTKLFEEYTINNPISIKEEKSITININDIKEESYNLIQSFGPFGEEWKAPILLLKNVKVSSLKYSKTNEHILTFISNNAKLTGFNFSKDNMSKYNFANLYGKLRINLYKGYKTTEYFITKVNESD